MSRPVSAVLGRLGRTQIRYVEPVSPRAADPYVARIYRQVDRDFGLLAPPVIMHAPARGPLAACWMLIREIMIVPGPAGRAAKEAVATAVSRANACPFCVTIHHHTLDVLGGSEASGPLTDWFSALSTGASPTIASPDGTGLAGTGLAGVIGAPLPRQTGSGNGTSVSRPADQVGTQWADPGGARTADPAGARSADARSAEAEGRSTGAEAWLADDEGWPASDETWPAGDEAWSARPGAQSADRTDARSADAGARSASAGAGSADAGAGSVGLPWPRRNSAGNTGQSLAGTGSAEALGGAEAIGARPPLAGAGASGARSTDTGTSFNEAETPLASRPPLPGSGLSSAGAGAAGARSVGAKVSVARVGASVAGAGTVSLGAPPFPSALAPELIGTATCLHYLNRMVNVFLGERPLPPGVPGAALGPVMRVLRRMIQRAAEAPHEPGQSLALLPPAALPADLAWAASSPNVADAVSRAAAAVELAGARSVSPRVRELLAAELQNWSGEGRGLSRAWVEELVARLPRTDRAVGRLALLTAFASYQVDQSVVDECELSDRALIEVTSWASMAAARRLSTRMWLAARQSRPASHTR